MAQYLGDDIFLGTTGSLNQFVESPLPLSAQQRTNDPDQATLEPVGQAATIAVNTGGLRLQYPLDFDQSPGTDVGGNPVLVYNSNTVSVQPIIEATLTPPANDGIPTSLQARLTWNNGQAEPWVVFNTAGHSAADSYLLAVQQEYTVAATGVYAWEMDVQAVYYTGKEN